MCDNMLFVSFKKLRIFLNLSVVINSFTEHLRKFRDLKIKQNALGSWKKTLKPEAYYNKQFRKHLMIACGHSNSWMDPHLRDACTAWIRRISKYYLILGTKFLKYGLSYLWLLSWIFSLCYVYSFTVFYAEVRKAAAISQFLVFNFWLLFISLIKYTNVCILFTMRP